MEASRRRAVQLDRCRSAPCFSCCSGRGFASGSDPPHSWRRRSANAVLTIRATSSTRAGWCRSNSGLPAMLESHVSERRQAAGLWSGRERVASSRTRTEHGSRAAPCRLRSTRCGASPGSVAGRRPTVPRRTAFTRFTCHHLTCWYRQAPMCSDFYRALPLSRSRRSGGHEGLSILTPSCWSRRRCGSPAMRGRSACLASHPRPLAPQVLVRVHRHRSNLALNTRKSYRDTFSLLLPFISRKVRKPVDRLAVWDLTSRTRVAVPRPSRDGSRVLRPDSQSAACRHPGVRALRRQPRPGPYRMVRSHPGHRVEEVYAAAGRTAAASRRALLHCKIGASREKEIFEPGDRRLKNRRFDALRRQLALSS